jgi:hypothetical protein
MRQEHPKNSLIDFSFAIMRSCGHLLTLSTLPAVVSFTVNTHSGNSLGWARPLFQRPKTGVNSIDGGRGEESQMNSYVNEFLGKDEKAKNIFLIALPCESCHELQIELESVQRAIVYNCPVAVHACIPTSITKVPLLTVSGDISTKQLRIIIEKVVQDNYDEMISLQFAGLDVEAGELSNNEVLHAYVSDKRDLDQYGAEETNNASISQLVDRLNRSILGETSCTTSISSTFRVPFMKLPSDWNELIANQNTTDFTPEYGGNGISPLHWFDWCEDRFGEPQRMREIALYNEQGKFPVATIPFPGSAVRNSNELKWEKYQDDRMKEVEIKLKDKNSSTTGGTSDELMLNLTRERLEKLYEYSGIPDESRPSETPPEDSVNSSASSKKEDDWLAIQDELLQDPQRETDPDAVDDWMRQRIRNIIEAKSKAKLAMAAKKEMPPVEENEIFAKYRRGEFAAQSDQLVPAKVLPPFPSREHCMGIWRMNASPTGFEIEVGDENRSDNIILRVDGTIAGGPILDKETRQKASGGTWRLKITESNRGELEVRLVIPPNKERVLVMRGTIALPTTSEIPLAGKTFGIPAVDNKAKAAKANENEFIDCYGSVWIEDAVTRVNKNEIGEFSMTKVSDLLLPNQFSITIPKNVRILD